MLCYSGRTHGGLFTWALVFTVKLVAGRGGGGGGGGGGSSVWQARQPHTNTHSERKLPPGSPEDFPFSDVCVSVTLVFCPNTLLDLSPCCYLRSGTSVFLFSVWSLVVEESFLCMFNPSSGCFSPLLVVGKFKWLTLCCSQECHCCFSSWPQRLWERMRRCISVTFCFVIWKLDCREIWGRVQVLHALHEIT